MMRPHTFGKFRILRKLPGGAMGVVHQALDTTANDPGTPCWRKRRPHLWTWRGDMPTFSATWTARWRSASSRMVRALRTTPAGAVGLGCGAQQYAQHPCARLNFPGAWSSSSGRLAGQAEDGAATVCTTR
jgi:hypothetical protein